VEPGADEEDVMMGRYGYGFDYGAWLVMTLFWLILLAAVAWVVVRLLAGRPQGAAQPPVQAASTPAGQPAAETPEDILDRRFARGELEIEAYQAQRAALRQARGDG
jgi:putative membrane protein